MGNRMMQMRRIGNPCANRHNVMRDAFKEKHARYEGILRLQNTLQKRKSRLTRSSRKSVKKPRKFKSKFAAYYRGANAVSIRRKNHLLRSDTLLVIENSINQQQKEREGRLAPCIDYFR